MMNLQALYTSYSKPASLFLLSETSRVLDYRAAQSLFLSHRDKCSILQDVLASTPVQDDLSTTLEDEDYELAHHHHHHHHHPQVTT